MTLYRFDQIAENINVRVMPSDTELDRYVGLEHLDPESLKIRRWGSPADVIGQKLRFWEGDIIYGRRRAYQRKVAVADFNGICSAHAMVLRAKPDVCLPEFLPFFLQSELFHQRALEISVGSLSPTINWTTLAGQEFPLPPLDEQRRIAALLWAADDVVTEWQNALGELERLKASTSLELFASNEKSVQVALDVLCREITVGIVVTPAKYYVPEGIPALRSLNVSPDRFVLEDLVYISDGAHQLHSKSRLLEGDVVIVRSGRPGDAAVIDSELDNCNCIDLIVVRPSEKVLPSYISRFINSAAGRRKIAQGTAGTAQLHFNVSQMKKMFIPLVSLERQNEIVGRLEAVDSLIEETNVHISRSRHLKDCYLRSLLSN